MKENIFLSKKTSLSMHIKNISRITEEIIQQKKLIIRGGTFIARGQVLPVSALKEGRLKVLLC